MAVYTLQQFEKFTATASFRNILDLIDLLKGVDYAKVIELLKLVETIKTAPDLTSQVQATLSLLSTVAQLTPTVIDDNLVALLVKVASPEIIAVLVRLVTSMLPSHAQTADVTITQLDRDTVASKSIDWSLIMSIAIQISQIIARLRQPTA